MSRPQDGNGLDDQSHDAGIKADIEAAMKEASGEGADDRGAPAGDDRGSPTASGTAAALRGEARPTEEAAPDEDKAKPAPGPDGRVRGPDGKFAKADEAPQIPAPDAPPTQDQAAATPAAPADGAVAPPEHWSQIEKDRFEAFVAKAGPEAGKMLLDARTSLERGFNEKFRQHAAKVQTADALDQIFAPLQQDLQHYRMTPLDAVQYLLRVQSQMRRDPASTLLSLAKDYGVDLTKMAASSGPVPAQPGAQPDGSEAMPFLDTAAERAIGELRQQFGPVQQQIQTIAQTLHATTSALQNAEAQRYQAHVMAFRDAKGADGKLLHPYYDELRLTMADLMTPRVQGQAPIAGTIEEAYEKACSLHPDISAKRQRDAERAWAEKAERERKDALARARPAPAAPNVAPAPTPRDKAAKKRDSVRDDLKAAWDEAARRA